MPTQLSLFPKTTRSAIRSQPNPCPHCGSVKPPKMLVCKKCWYALPMATRIRILSPDPATRRAAARELLST